MRFRFLAWCCVCTVTATVALAADRTVVSVGDSALDASTVANRLSRTPDYQLARYGKTPEAARKAFVDQVLVPELLFAEEGKRRKLDQSPGLHDKVLSVLKDALERGLREEVMQKTPVTPDEIKTYFEGNKERFEVPRRIRLWKILVKDEQTARKIIADARGTDALKKWSQFARENSLDKATALRNGDLGMVRPDGSTDAPRVKVRPEIVAAAEKLKDGQLSTEPVPEGDGFAVLWRRGTMPETKRTLAQEQSSIRQLLERRRAEEARTALLASLKQRDVKEQHAELLEHIDSETFGPPPKRRPNDPDGGLRRRRPDRATPPASSGPGH